MSFGTIRLKFSEIASIIEKDVNWIVNLNWKGKWKQMKKKIWKFDLKRQKTIKWYTQTYIHCLKNGNSLTFFLAACLVVPDLWFGSYLVFLWVGALFNLISFLSLKSLVNASIRPYEMPRIFRASLTFPASS